MGLERAAAGGAPAGAASTWHASPALVTAYAAGRAGEVDSWSLEAHLTGCPLCRAEVAAAVHTHGRQRDRDLLAEGRARLLAALPAAGPGAASPGAPSHRRRRAVGPRVHWPWLLRPKALLAVVIAAAAAVALTAVAGASADGGAGDAGRLLWLLAPVIPVAGVALCSTGGSDPWREVVLSTPSAGLRLVLWRTAVVLGVAVPLAVVAGLVAAPPGEEGPWPVLWLLPALALVSTTLALGSVLLLERAAWVVAGLWCTLLLAPVVLDPGTTGASEADRLVVSASRWSVTALAGPTAQSAWALLALGAMAVVVWRRGAYEQLSAAPRSSTA